MVQKTTNFLICSNCLITYWRELFFSPFSPWEKTGHAESKESACEQAAYAYEKVVLNAFKDAYNAIAEYNKVKEIYETLATGAVFENHT